MSTAMLCRGQIVSVAASGIYSGKPRPAVVVQADLWLDVHPSVTLCPITSTLVQAPLIRIPVEPSPSNGLQKSSQLMADKLFSMPRTSIDQVIGQLDIAHVVELDQALRSWLGLG